MKVHRRPTLVAHLNMSEPFLYPLLFAKKSGSREHVPFVVLYEFRKPDLSSSLSLAMTAIHSLYAIADRSTHN